VCWWVLICTNVVLFTRLNDKRDTARMFLRPVLFVKLNYFLLEENGAAAGTKQLSPKG